MAVQPLPYVPVRHIEEPDPEVRGILMRLVRRLGKQNDNGEAVRICDETFVQLGDRDWSAQIIPVLRERRRAGDNIEFAALHLSNALMRGRRFDLGIAVCTELLEHPDLRNRALTLYNRGVGHRDNGDTDAALDDFGAAIELNPRFCQALNNRGDMLYKSGALEEAQRLVETAVEEDPDFAMAYWTLANIRAAREDRDGFLESVGEALRRGCPVWEEIDPRFAEDPKYLLLVSRHRS